MSAICESFDTVPDVAQRQNWRLVRAILDYRNAEAAVHKFNGPNGAEALAASPGLSRVLLAMHRAQNGGHGTLDEVVADLQSRRPTED